VPRIAIARVLKDLGSIMTTRGGHSVLCWSHDVHRQVALKRYLPDAAATTANRALIIKMFMARLKADLCTERVARELPWLCLQTGDKDGLKQCLYNVHMFTLLRDAMDRGVRDLQVYWKALKENPVTVAEQVCRVLQGRFLELRADISKNNSELKRLARACSQTGAFLRDAGHCDQATAPLQMVLDIYTGLYGLAHDDTANAYAELGQAYCDMKMYDLSLKYLGQAVKTAVDLHGPSAPAASKAS
jgi:tetratricopeptide (TPR) repeat protein